MQSETSDARTAVLDPALEPTANRVELIGYVGSNPELRYTRDAIPFVRFSLATHRWREVDGAWQQLTDWHTVVTYDEPSERSARLRVGELVRVMGSLRTASWTDRAGGYRRRTEVLATRVERAVQLPRQERLPLSA
jgi:single-strand DNA-binding protein